MHTALKFAFCQSLCHWNAMSEMLARWSTKIDKPAWFINTSKYLWKCFCSRNFALVIITESFSDKTSLVIVIVSSSDTYTLDVIISRCQGCCELSFGHVCKVAWDALMKGWMLLDVDSSLTKTYSASLRTSPLLGELVFERQRPWSVLVSTAIILQWRPSWARRASSHWLQLTGWNHIVSISIAYI